MPPCVIGGCGFEGAPTPRHGSNTLPSTNDVTKIACSANQGKPSLLAGGQLNIRSARAGQTEFMQGQEPAGVNQRPLPVSMASQFSSRQLPADIYFAICTREPAAISAASRIAGRQKGSVHGSGRTGATSAESRGRIGGDLRFPGSQLYPISGTVAGG